MSFNPRARVGRDCSKNWWRRSYNSFNPRARVGRDTTTLFLRSMSMVSIHAPAWGATEVEND